MPQDNMPQSQSTAKDGRRDFVVYPENYPFTFKDLENIWVTNKLDVNTPYRLVPDPNVEPLLQRLIDEQIRRDPEAKNYLQHLSKDMIGRILLTNLIAPLSPEDQERVIRRIFIHLANRGKEYLYPEAVFNKAPVYFRTLTSGYQPLEDYAGVAEERPIYLPSSKQKPPANIVPLKRDIVIHHYLDRQGGATPYSSVLAHELMHVLNKTIRNPMTEDELKASFLTNRILIGRYFEQNKPSFSLSNFLWRRSYQISFVPLFSPSSKKKNTDEYSIYTTVYKLGDTYYFGDSFIVNNNGFKKLISQIDDLEYRKLMENNLLFWPITKAKSLMTGRDYFGWYFYPSFKIDTDSTDVIPLSEVLAEVVQAMYSYYRKKRPILTYDDFVGACFEPGWAYKNVRQFLLNEARKELKGEKSDILRFLWNNIVGALAQDNRTLRNRQIGQEQAFV